MSQINKNLNTSESPQDWELSDDFYHNGPEQDLKLEDFICGEESEPEPGLSSPYGGKLEQTVRDVTAVLNLSEQGRSLEGIASELNLEPSYVQLILQCSQGAREDDATAMAHLVLMSL